MSKALQKQLVASATGKHAEPTAGLVEVSKMELVRALNFYNNNIDEKTKQKYAFSWISKNRPDLLANAKRAPMYSFGTFAALMRLDSRGFQLSPEHRAQMIAWAESLGPRKEDDEDETPKVVKVKKAKVNVTMQNFDDALDQALVDPSTTFEVDFKSDTAPVVQYCQDQLDLIAEDADQYPKHMKKWFKSVIEKLDGVKKAVKQKRVVTRKPRKVDPAKLTKSVKFLEKDDSLKLTSLKPKDVIGKKKVYVFDTKYRRLTKLVAAGDAGISFKGTSFVNLDLDKSVSKTLRKPAEVLKPGMGIRELDRAFGLVKGKDNAVSGQRGSDNLIILQAS